MSDFIDAGDFDIGSNAFESNDTCLVIDHTFGPYAKECRGGFDFTLLFEETILTVLPAALFIIAASLRLFYLARQPHKVYPGFTLYLKLALYLVLTCLQLGLIVIWSGHQANKTQATTQTNSVSLISLVLLGFLSFFEHLRSIKPSLIIFLFLFFTLLFDIARARTLWLRDDHYPIRNVVFSVATGVKLVVLFFETFEKETSLRPEFEASPEEAISGPLNRAFFWWLNPLFKRGFSSNLAVDDLFKLDDRLESKNVHRTLNFLWKQGEVPSNSLFSATLGAVNWSLLSAIIPRLCLMGFNFTQPFLINAAIELSQKPVNPQTTAHGIGLIGAYIIVYIGIAIATGQVQHLTYRTVTMVRGGLVSMLYSKTADLNVAAVNPSEAVILMSADIERITTGWERVHELWANLIEIGLAIYLLKRQLGVACAIPVGVALFSMMGSIAASGLIMERQAKWLEAIERRVTATTAMLGAMKGIKMCGLTDILFTTLQKLRVDELEISKAFRKVIVWNMAFSFSTPVIAPILTFATYSLLARRSENGATLDTARVFTSLSLFTLLAEPLGSWIMALANFMGSVGSFQRIQEFLNTEVRVDDRKISRPFDLLDKDFTKFFREPGLASSQHTLRADTPPEYPGSPSTAIVVKDGGFGWDKEKQPVVQQITLTVPKEKFVMLVGPVGCGKSTLIKAILGETHKFGGTVQVASPEVAYCDQTPWHMNATVQQSIIGVSELDEMWYKTVLQTCALDADLKQLAKGDQTQIGSAGVALSGGQSQRIALARAVYARQDIIILDDVFRGLDAETENQVFHNLLGPHGLWRKHHATVFMASASATRLPYADHIIALNKDGKISEQGTFAQLNAAGGYVSSFNMSPADWNLDVDPDAIVSSDNGTPRFSYDLDKKKVSSSLEDFLDMESIDEKRRKRVSVEPEDDPSRRMGDTSVYMYYIAAVGWLPTIIFVIAICAFVVCYSYPAVWVKKWAEANARDPNGRMGYYLGIYAAVGGACIISLIISAWQMIITMVPRSGEKFHWILLKTVLASPMSFFSSTDTGVTLNRFSQDLQLIDMDLPLAALNTFAMMMLCIAQVVLIGVASKYAPIAFPVILIALYFIQRHYLRTSRQLRFLDIEAKSPLYSNFLECLSGLVTIRAFGWGKALEKKNLKMLNQSQRPFYQLFLVQRWLVLVLDLVVAAIAVLLCVLVVTLRGKLSSGFVGVALLNVILFSQSIKLLLTFWTEVETHIGSIARIKSFTTNAESEVKVSESQEPPPEWPARGAIKFSNVSACYKPGELVLKDITLSIPSGQKIGIVGRTGSGKSSLLLALFRMLTLTSGTITLDTLDISLIPRQLLRSRLNGVPQDAYFLAGSIRLNADPRSLSSDREVVRALKAVQLWELIRGAGGLAVDIEEVHLTHGQKQLFCIARAILRKSSVLVLDEATSSVDAHTDALIQTLVRAHFSRCTVVSVAHKLDTVLDFDQVVVMDKGRVVEVGIPYALLEDEGSWFSRLYYALLAKEEADVGAVGVER